MEQFVQVGWVIVGQTPRCMIDGRPPFWNSEALCFKCISNANPKLTKMGSEWIRASLVKDVSEKKEWEGDKERERDVMKLPLAILSKDQLV